MSFKDQTRLDDSTTFQTKLSEKPYPDAKSFRIHIVHIYFKH